MAELMQEHMLEMQCEKSARGISCPVWVQMLTMLANHAH